MVYSIKVVKTVVNVSLSFSAEANLVDIPHDDPDDPARVPPLQPPPIPEKELVLVGKRTLDVNYFVECLRRVNRHHAAMQCSISDMIICEEQVKGRQRGIVFRSVGCLQFFSLFLSNG